MCGKSSYVLRPPLTMDRIRWHEGVDEGGEVELSLPRPWSDGTTALRFDPLTFIGRLVPLIPAPRRHQVRYHGILAPNARWRPEVVAQAPAAGGLRRPRGLYEQPSQTPRPRRLLWAELLRRTFAIDVLRCARCGSRRQLLAVIRSQQAVQAILTHLDGVSVGGPRAPPSQRDLL